MVICVERMVEENDASMKDVRVVPKRGVYASHTEAANAASSRIVPVVLNVWVCAKRMEEDENA